MRTAEAESKRAIDCAGALDDSTIELLESAVGDSHEWAERSHWPECSSAQVALRALQERKSVRERLLSASYQVRESPLDDDAALIAAAGTLDNLLAAAAGRGIALAGSPHLFLEADDFVNPFWCVFSSQRAMTQLCGN